jgi:hypothetical protein
MVPRSQQLRRCQQRRGQTRGPQSGRAQEGNDLPTAKRCMPTDLHRPRVAFLAGRRLAVGPTPPANNWGTRSTTRSHLGKRPEAPNTK